MLDPLVFEPWLRPQIWGNRRLADLGKRLPDSGTFGESWEISGHPQHVSRVADGPFQGATLSDLWDAHGSELWGAGPVPAKFPLLIKFLDCHEQLSVQVHPDDAIARELLGDELGKTEAWLVMDVAPTGRIYAGLKQGTTRAELERHLDTGTVAECLHSFVPRPGDCVFLKAGTVHAVGGGVLMAEVQQTSDATFRLFDWNRLGTDGRPRQLHREQSLRSIDWSAGPVSPVSPTPLAGFPDGVSGEQLVACPYFEMARFQLSRTMPLPVDGGLSIWIVVEGELELVSEAGGYRRTVRRGETVLVPASAGGLIWKPRGQSVLLCAIPQ